MFGGQGGGGGGGGGGRVSNQSQSISQLVFTRHRSRVSRLPLPRLLSGGCCCCVLVQHYFMQEHRPVPILSLYQTTRCTLHYRHFFFFLRCFFLCAIFSSYGLAKCQQLKCQQLQCNTGNMIGLKKHQHGRGRRISTCSLSTCYSCVACTCFPECVEHFIFYSSTSNCIA